MPNNTTTAQKVERKYLAHYLDASFGGETANYVRIGADLEEYEEDLSPDVEVKKNILGEQSVQHSGYEVKSEVDPYYARIGDALFERVWANAQERKTGDDLKTTRVDVLLNTDGTVHSAYQEDCYLIPTKVGGDTSGVQVPFTVYNAGNRKRVNWDTSTNTPSTYTASSSGGGSGNGVG